MNNSRNQQVSVLAFVMLVCGLILPLRVNSGSLYSSKGVGLWRYFASGQGAGMGGVGIAVTDHLSINQLNPATRYPFLLTRISGTFVYDKNITQAPTGSAVNEQSLTAGFSFLVPIGRRVSFSSSLNQVSAVNFRANEAGSINGSQFEREVRGEGGLNKLEGSIFYMPWSRLYLGAAANFYFGQIKETWKVDFSSSMFKDSNDQYATSLRGLNTTLGLLAKPTSKWNVGAFISPEVTLRGKAEIAYTHGKIDTIDNVKRTIPLMWGAGTTYQIMNWLMIGAEYQAQKWGDIAEVPSTLWGYHNGVYYVLGMEVTPTGRGSTHYFKRVSYRLGYRYGNVHLRDYEKDSINEYVFTFGLGLPFNVDQGRIDIALELGRRGNLDRNPVEENILRVLVTAITGERWFIRRP